MIWSLIDSSVSFIVHENGKGKDVNDNCLLKISMSFLNICNESKDNDNITITLTFSYTNLHFFLKKFDF